MNQLTFTLSVKKFCELAITGFKGYIEETDKQLIDELAKADVDEVFIHIECVSSNLLWQIWAIQDWKIAKQKWDKDKAASEADRIATAKLRRNIEKLSAAIKKMTGLEQEVCNLTALTIINKKRSGAKNFGVELED